MSTRNPIDQDKALNNYRAIMHRWIHSERIKKMTQGQGLFEGCASTLESNGLSKQTRSIILSYLNNPTLDHWRRVRGFEVRPGKTLWRAWLCADKNAPERESEQYPDAERLRQGIRALAESDHQEILGKMISAAMHMAYPIEGDPSIEYIKKEDASDTFDKDEDSHWPRLV